MKFPPIEAFELIIKSINELIDREKEKEKEILNDFIIPTYTKFEELHKNYISSFFEYKRTISESYFLSKDHEIFNQINEDTLLSNDLRSKLIILMDYSEDTKVGAFIHSIILYILGYDEYQEYLVEGSYSEANYPREKLTESLASIFEKKVSLDDKKKEALDLMDFIIKKMQEKYAIVTKEFNEIKLSKIVA